MALTHLGAVQASNNTSLKEEARYCSKHSAVAEWEGTVHVSEFLLITMTRMALIPDLDDLNFKNSREERRTEF